MLHTKDQKGVFSTQVVKTSEDGTQLREAKWSPRTVFTTVVENNTVLNREINENTTTRKEFDDRWVHLAVQLNEIGPPTRDVWEWRRVWSVYKYNQKRKQPTPTKSSKRRLIQDPRSNRSGPDDKPVTVSTKQQRSQQTQTDDGYHIALSQPIEPTFVLIEQGRSHHAQTAIVHPPDECFHIPMSEQDQPTFVLTELQGSHHAQTAIVHPSDDGYDMALSEQTEPIFGLTEEQRSHHAHTANAHQSAEQTDNQWTYSERMLHSVAVQLLAKLDKISEVLIESRDMLKMLIEKEQHK